MIHPGPWQNYKNRLDNKDLTVEELTYKYKQELLVHENFNYQQIQIQHQDNQGKRAPVTSNSLEYPEFSGGPYTEFKATQGRVLSGTSLTWPFGILTESQINTIIAETATATNSVGGYTYEHPINSLSEITIGERLTGYYGGATYMTFVTNRNIVQDGTDNVNVANDGVPWTTGTLEYIITYAISAPEYSGGEIVNIHSFIVP